MANQSKKIDFEAMLEKRCSLARYEKLQSKAHFLTYWQNSYRVASLQIKEKKGEIITKNIYYNCPHWSYTTNICKST